MILFKGKPVLEYNIELCRKFGITDIYINVHHLSHVIRDYFGSGESKGVKITYSYEEDLLGTSGATRRIFESFWDKDHSASDPFFVVYGDNFSDYNLQSLVDVYKQHSEAHVIGFHYREDVSSSGVAEFTNDGRIITFIEKPSPGQTESHWVNAGIYFLNPSVMNFIPQGYSDFAKDVFPTLLANNIPLYGVKNTSDVKAFDTPEMMKKNLE